MMPLASWLDCHWRHPSRHEAGYWNVCRAAQKLDLEIWNQHGIKLLYLDDPWRFRDISTAEVMRAQRLDMGLGDADFPQLGTHADPTCRELNADNFYALIGTRTDRPLPLITMNTAALYEAGIGLTEVADLFITRRLWSDHPDRDCAGLETSSNTGLRLQINLPAVFLGTAWTTEERRHQGIMTDVSRLHRMVAWLRWPIPQFATVAPDSGAEKVFAGRDIGAVIETRGDLSTESRVRFYEADAAPRDAESVLKDETKAA